MNPTYVQNLRYKLQKRYRRLNSTNTMMFHIVLQQFWGFLQSYPIFVGILQSLKSLFPQKQIQADNIVNCSIKYYSNDELETAALSYLVIEKCIDSDKPKVEEKIGNNYKGGGEIEGS